ncbi:MULTISPECIES: DUF3389 family protein [Shewanella]|uniref:DUF3389 family protein n=1 Tax=Shewanella fidelis TaxID=173509 RepID=A0AAW8NLA3_9GAMM|nr:MULTISPECIES: DUF3389 family protein [Shewanella]MDR8523642.1 DUF3389 family protein [Shewanella fidelis]MDW4810189.1 DUF3389 family protein [Shewanella fidelis]MDW4814334.1 DUF3389 family protein [Shewanella fidelis]MDW4818425.1 DUF3389 family protein [Shewanella fidelis]MDW4823923.1 DUF3389 family protein [Shewanella fidelis]
MIIQFSAGKLILSPYEVQARLDNGCQLYAMVDDIKFHDDALMLVADAGAVRWNIKLDSSEQLQEIKHELGIS